MVKDVAKKAGLRATRRRKTVRVGDVRRGPEGEVIMDFVADVTDLGAPEYVVTGIASIERISVGLLRITKYVHRKDGNFITFHEVWDYQSYLRFSGMIGQAMQIISRMAISDGHESQAGKH